MILLMTKNVLYDFFGRVFRLMVKLQGKLMEHFAPHYINNTVTKYSASSIRLSEPRLSEHQTWVIIF